MHRLNCDLCNTPIPPHGHYIVKIEVYADPAMPPVDLEALEETDTAAQMQDLLEQMKHLNEDDLMDQVHRAFEFILCRACQRKFLANPLGKPRSVTIPRN